MSKILVYVVDDSAVVGSVVKMIVARDVELVLCGVANDAEEALGNVANLAPDVILLDLSLPGMDGLDLLNAIKQRCGTANVIVVSGSATHGASICNDAFARGAAACFDKTRLLVHGEELISLIHEVCDHKILPSRHLSGTVTLPPEKRRAGGRAG